MTAVSPATRIAYLGPPGTFSEDACIERFGDAPLVACATIADAVETLARGDAELAVVPVENSRVGVIAETAEAMRRHEGSLVTRERVEIPVRHQLVALPGTSLDAVRRVASHPQALAQCRSFLAAHLPGVSIEEAGSTAAAVQIAADQRGTAAIASRRAASLHGCAVVVADIGDHDDTVTTFAVVERLRHE